MADVEMFATVITACDSFVHETAVEVRKEKDERDERSGKGKEE